MPNTSMMPTMGTVIVETLICAPLERCFDLARSADFHVASTKHTGEKIVSGVSTGLLKLGDIVEFKASHFGLTQRLSSQITSFERPNHFRDSQVKGIFRSFSHDHYFEVAGDNTMMKDIFKFDCPYGLFGKLADPFVARHLSTFLKIRAMELKRSAENEEWRSFI